MSIRKLMMMLVAGCAVGMLTGCGVPKDEHAAVVADLNDALEQVEVLKGEKVAVEESLQDEQKKIRQLRLEVDDAINTAEELKANAAADAETLAAAESKISQLESSLAVMTSAKNLAMEKISELEAALAALQAENEQLINRFNQLKKNMLSAGGGMSAPTSAPALAPAPAADSGGKSAKSAMDLLDEMSRQ